MALVVLLRGVNVGGHRTFRPASLARELKHMDAVNIGAAGTFVVRRPVTRAQLRAEVTRRLPYDSHVMICTGREIARLTSRDYFADQPVRPDIVRFVSVLSRRPRSKPPIPMSLPPGREWLLKVLATEDRFVVGLYRRQMKAIGCLGTLDRLFGSPATTRNWNTMIAIAKALSDAENPMRGAESTPQSIDEYIRGFPADVRRSLSQLRSMIRKAAPDATEKISYGMPTFYQNGNLVHFAAFPRHIGFYPTPAPIVAFRDQLKSFKTSKGAIQFPIDEPLPSKLIERIVKFRVADTARRQRRAPKKSPAKSAKLRV